MSLVDLEKVSSHQIRDLRWKVEWVLSKSEAHDVLTDEDLVAAHCCACGDRQAEHNCQEADEPGGGGCCFVFEKASDGGAPVSVGKGCRGAGSCSIREREGGDVLSP